MTGQLSLERARKVIGWMTERELSFLAKRAREAKTIIEIGSFAGKSARALADNSSPDSRIYCVDPWNYVICNTNHTFTRVDDTTFTQFCLNLNDHINSGKVIPITKPWSDAEIAEEADFIFIDGDHTYESVIFDIGKALLTLRDGGIIAGHDYNWPGVKQAVDEYFPDCEVKLEDTIWWIQKF